MKNSIALLPIWAPHMLRSPRIRRLTRFVETHLSLKLGHYLLRMSLKMGWWPWKLGNPILEPLEINKTLFDRHVACKIQLLCRSLEGYSPCIYASSHANPCRQIVYRLALGLRCTRRYDYFLNAWKEGAVIGSSNLCANHRSLPSGKTVGKMSLLCSTT